MVYTNSPLVNHIHISPNQSGRRNHPIDRISPHCVVGQVSVETLGNIFAPPDKGASSNYGIGFDGRKGMYVEEEDRSWCTSSAANDNRAVTIEVASDSSYPYGITPAAYNSLIELMADICKRNGKTRLLWFADKEKTLNYAPKAGEMVVTVHRWFDDKSCPGDYIFDRLPEITAAVNKKLNMEEDDMTKAEVLEIINANDPMRHDLKDVPAYWREDVAQLVREGAICGDGKHQVEKRDSQIAAMVAMKRHGERQDPIYRTVDDVPEWGRPAVQALIDSGRLAGEAVLEDGTRILNIRRSAVRLIKMMAEPTADQTTAAPGA